MNALALQFAAQRFAETSETRLRGRVSRVERQADEGDARGNVDDEAVSAGPQMRERGARQQDRRDEIDFDHRPDFGLGSIVQVASPGAAGVVDKNIEAVK